MLTINIQRKSSNYISSYANLLQTAWLNLFFKLPVARFFSLHCLKDNSVSPCNADRMIVNCVVINRFLISNFSSIYACSD